MQPKKTYDLTRRTLFGGDQESGEKDRVFSVFEVAELGRRTIESRFPFVRVQGEVSNVTYAASGHLYFTLKDPSAQIAAVMWKSAVVRMPLRLVEGMAVRVSGSLTIYPARGTFQIVCERVELTGRGALEERLRELKKHFERLGYFAPERKRELPFLPAKIGIVTSPTGAAIHDILRTIFSRFPKAHILFRPVRVQGQGAADEIAAAVDLLNTEGSCDVLIVGRGGGSLEDLWAFNEAPVVEAIYRSAIPVVSAVGHEIDVSLADLVADVRALTPTNAGELVCPDLFEVTDTIHMLRGRAVRSVRHAAGTARMRKDAALRSWAFREPKRLIERRLQWIDERKARMITLVRKRFDAARARFLSVRIDEVWKKRRSAIQKDAALVLRLREELRRSLTEIVAARRLALGVATARLSALSPLETLARGFSITTDAAGKILRDPSEVVAGQTVRTRLFRGEISSRVESAAMQEGGDENRTIL